MLTGKVMVRWSETEEHLGKVIWKNISMSSHQKKKVTVFLYIVTNTFPLQSELEIEPRYPLFGGWKATFVIGYGLPLQDFLFESPDGRRYLNFSFGCTFAETVVDKLTIKVSSVT